MDFKVEGSRLRVIIGPGMRGKIHFCGRFVAAEQWAMMVSIVWMCCWWLCKCGSIGLNEVKGLGVEITVWYSG